MRKLFATRRFGLLTKELHEQASRRRTYVLRVLYAIAAYGIFLIFYGEMYQWISRGGFTGMGEAFFVFAIGMGFGAVFLILPALVAGVITQEKERDSLGLVLISDLRPWEVLIEKLLGRIIPFLGYLAMLAPIIGFAYALGGVNTDQLLSGGVFLVLCTLQVGCLALCFSCFFRSTAAAFVGTYLGGLAFYFGPAAVGEILGLPWATRQWLVELCPAVLYVESYNNPQLGVIARAWHVPLTTAGLFLIARFFLWRRAFVRPRSWLKEIFERLDRLLIPRGVDPESRENREVDLPQDTRPIRWLELSTRAMGKPRYLLRIFLALQILVVLLCEWAMVETRVGTRDSEEFALLVLTMWSLAALLMVVVAASTISGDRTRQTLDVLLTTPISGQDIVRDKVAVPFRLMAVLLIPFLTAFISESQVEIQTDTARTYYRYKVPLPPSLYVTLSTLWFLLYMPMSIWFGTWIGLRSRSRTRGAITAVIGLVAWIFVPILLFALFGAWMMDINERDLGSYLVLASPMSFLVMTEIWWESGSIFDGALWPPAILNFLIYGGITLWLRARCFRDADWHLGRGRKPESQRLSARIRRWLPWSSPGMA